MFTSSVTEWILRITLTIEMNFGNIVSDYCVFCLETYFILVECDPDTPTLHVI